MAIEYGDGELTDLKRLMDDEDEPPAKRGRGREGGRRGRGGSLGGHGAVGRTHRKDDRTMKWGPVLLTFSTKADGSEVVQATCHHKHLHPHPPGKPSTLCRQTFNVTEMHNEADCIRLLKMWVCAGKDFTTRLKHQAKRFALDELIDDLTLQAYKPDSDYDTSSDKELIADPAPVVGRRRLKIRARAKRPPSEDAPG